MVVKERISLNIIKASIKQWSQIVSNSGHKKEMLILGFRLEYQTVVIKKQKVSNSGHKKTKSIKQWS